MKFDYYCVALVVLVLFFLYIDNSLNLEGFASLDELDSPDVSNGKKVGFVDNIKGMVTDTNMGIQDSEIIGARPKKIETTPPPSIQKNLQLLSKPTDLSSLDPYFMPISGDIKISKQVPTNLLNIEARFSGPGNLGSDVIGSVGAPVNPTVNNNEVSGVPILDNPSIGAPLNYGMDTISLSNSVVPKLSNVGNILSNKTQTDGSSNKKLELHMVYTNWCGHSKRALPDYDKVMNELHGSTLGSHDISVIKHDADTPEGKEFAKEHGVRGFPTHFLIVEGKKIESGIGRTYDEIMSKIKSITG